MNQSTLTIPSNPANQQDKIGQILKIR